MDIVGWVLGVIGIIVAIFGVLDARRQRSVVERLQQHQSETINNLHGFLLGMKSSSTVNIGQVDDRLEYIKQRNEQFRNISSGGA